MSQGHIPLIYCDMEQLDFFNTLEQTKSICPVCGNGFEKTRSNHIYCSKNCGDKKYKENVKKLKVKIFGVCKKCGNNFEKKKSNQIYCSKYCNKKRYCDENKEKILDRNRNYQPVWREDNKDKILSYRLKYKNDIDKIIKKREYQKKYDKENREIINEKYKNRKKTNPNVKIRETIRRRIRDVLKNSGGKKFCKSMVLLGCTIQEAREHLETQFKEGMTWENHGNDGWHIDHIIPCASFDLTDPEQQKKCFHYTNLQPLWAKENMSKGAKIL